MLLCFAEKEALVEQHFNALLREDISVWSRCNKWRAICVAIVASLAVVYTVGHDEVNAVLSGMRARLTAVASGVMASRQWRNVALPGTLTYSVVVLLNVKGCRSAP